MKTILIVISILALKLSSFAQVAPSGVLVGDYFFDEGPAYARSLWHTGIQLSFSGGIYTGNLYSLVESDTQKVQKKFEKCPYLKVDETKKTISFLTYEGSTDTLQGIFDDKGFDANGLYFAKQKTGLSENINNVKLTGKYAGNYIAQSAGANTQIYKLLFKNGVYNGIYEENMDGTKNTHELKNLIIDEVNNTINFYEDKNLVKGVFKSEDGNLIIELEDGPPNYTRQ
jgi:hypothetical protein